MALKGFQGNDVSISCHIKVLLHAIYQIWPFVSIQTPIKAGYLFVLWIQVNGKSNLTFIMKIIKFDTFPWNYR